MGEILNSLPIVAPLILVQFLLMIIALISLIKAEQTNGPKAMWAVIVIFIGFIGPILFFIIGRRQY
ncbi:PLD nuclease N-terminal domain-containing protein [Gracilibacillus kekensis]|uniref:Phospholipase_D-nuclease N-terminal n=1 Tax=Gracilibacillus kekensis TaxID=1027249 RepID=A0A1M7QCV5_9BACI|nr:PLD nuclease N-terminal domain-containing protein [Gracilibacillus kekensis]SHN28414.1 Phospholipase_D-nuclease N-terminal [Gracilibacillus kekensis]